MGSKITKEEGTNSEQDQPRILALGDSLTHGFYFRGYKQHPYVIKLNELLKKNEIDFEAVEYGKNGEITEDMYTRCEEILKLNEKNQFKIAIILGGTNNLAYKLSGEQIFENLKKIHELCKSHGMITVCLTRPENVFDQDYEEYKERKNVANNLLREYVKSNEKMILCDLFHKISWSNSTEDERKSLWDDDLHFKPEGYDKMGEEIFNAFFEKYSNK